MSHNRESEVNEKWCVSCCCIQFIGSGTNTTSSHRMNDEALSRERASSMFQPAQQMCSFRFFSIEYPPAGAGKMHAGNKMWKIPLNRIYDLSNMLSYRPYSAWSRIFSRQGKPQPIKLIRLPSGHSSYVFCLSAYQHIECLLINSGNWPQKKAFHFIRTDLADCTSQFSM